MKKGVFGILLLLIALVLLPGCIDQRSTPIPPIQQQSTPTPSTLLDLSEAIREQVVKAEIWGTGSSSGDSILLKLTRLVPRTIQINIPIGTVLISDDPSVQSMVIRKVKGIAVGAMRYQPVKSIILDSNEPREYVLEAYCLDFHKENPSKESTFWVSPNPANSEIIDVLKTADRLDPEIATVPAIQTAIWALTEDMSEDELKERFRVTPEDIENAKAVLDTAGFEAKTFRLYTPPSPTPVPTPSPGDGTSFDSPKLLKANTKLPVELQTPKGAAREASKELYLYITGVKPGQKVVVKGRILEMREVWMPGYRVALLNEERGEILSGSLRNTGSFTLEWLTSSEKPSYWFFIKVSIWASTELPRIGKTPGPGKVICDLEYWVEDASDANLGTDAGSSFVTASRIVPGRYEGYLGVKSGGNDAADYYKIHVKEGEKLLLKLIPESDTTLHLALYDQGRKKVKEASSSNPGAIITLSWTSPASQYVYIAVNRWAPLPFRTITFEKPITKYTLSIETEDAL